MKKILTFCSFYLATSCLFAQSIQEISTAAGYQKQSFVNLAAGTEKLVNNNSWDIAFTVFGQQDAGVFINESAGTSMGQPQAAIELFDALTDDFSEQPDPALLVDYQLFNAEKTWSYGAFNERRNAGNPFDFGWGAYNPQTNQVVGNAVYVIKLRNGQYRKFKIESLSGTTYTFKYANLDGTNESTKSLNKADHNGKILAYFSFETGNPADVEPSGGFDLLYYRYITPLFDPGTIEYIPYAVTGILHGRGARVAEADGVNPNTVAFSDFQDSLKTELDGIGYDWKSFSGTAWSVDQDRVFFLKTAEGRVWKLQFIDFEGSSTGKTILEKTDLGIIAAVKNPGIPNLEVLAYPNPVVDQFTVSLDVPQELATEARLEVLAPDGRFATVVPNPLTGGFQVFQISANDWSAGTYVLQLRLPNQTVQLGKVVKF